MEKVLFIGLDFFGYDEAICKELRDRGYKIDFFSGLTPLTFFRKVFIRLGIKSYLKKGVENYQNYLISQINSNYDIVFVIGGIETSKSFVNKLKDKNPNAKYILYLWDSFERMPNIELVLHCFDCVYSFDRLDCLSSTQMIFLPLFYRTEYYKESINDAKFDIYHLGSQHSNRLRIIKQVALQCDKNNLSYKFRLRVGKITYWRNVIFGGQLRGAKRFLIFEDWSHSKNASLIEEAKAILDIQHPTQKGLTMRTIELLAMRKKIITTNEDIVNYDFYFPENVFIIDAENPKIDKEFFIKPSVILDKMLIEKYSIKNWVKTIFP